MKFLKVLAFNHLPATTFFEVSNNSGPTDVINADSNFPKPIVTSIEAELLIQSKDFNTMAKVGST